MNEGPTEFIKLSLEGTTNLIHSHFSQPFLLRTTSKALTNYNTFLFPNSASISWLSNKSHSMSKSKQYLP